MGQVTPSNGGNRPARIITELPPPTQLDIEWSPVLTRSNERILKLGDLMVLSTPLSSGSNGKHGDEGHKKLSRFFGGSTTKKRQRLVMVTSSGRIILAPSGGEEKRAKQELLLLAPGTSWRTQQDVKGQFVWCVDTVCASKTAHPQRVSGQLIKRIRVAIIIHLKKQKARPAQMAGNLRPKNGLKALNEQETWSFPITTLTPMGVTMNSQK
jgi:hypothetical protein